MDDVPDDLARLTDRLDRMRQRWAVMSITRPELVPEVAEIELFIHDLNNLRMIADNWKLWAKGINGYEPEQ